MEVSDGIVLLTDLSYTMANDHVTVGLWGGCNSEGSYKEFNHYLNLKAGGWGFALWDTYNFSPGASYNNKEYWNYSAHTTGRFLDATLSYQFQDEKFPLLLSLVNGSLRTRPQQQQHEAEIFHLRLCGISYLSEGWLEGRCRSWWSLRPEQSWRGCPLLWNHGRHRSRIAASLPRSQTRQLHHSGLCQGHVESAEQREPISRLEQKSSASKSSIHKSFIITII